MPTPLHDEPDNNQVSQLLLSRRRLLSLAGLSVAGLGLAACGSSSSSTASASSAGTSTAECMTLTAEQIEGPYYLDDELVRQDITEGKPGVPLTLTLSAVDAATCAPLTNAAIEIWHCDSQGIYSGYAQSTTAYGPPSGSIPSGAPPSGESPEGGGFPGGAGGGAAHQTPINDLTFFRGMQMTDANGTVTFTTIVPGWYAGRAVHIHTKVHVDGTAGTTGYTGGHQAHTGQLYFAETAMVELSTQPDYVGNPVARVLLDDDSIYPGGGATGGLLTLDYTAGAISSGVRASQAMAVDTSGTHDGSDAPAMSFPTG